MLNTHVPGSVLSTLPELSQIIILIQPCEIDTNILPFSDEATVCKDINYLVEGDTANKWQSSDGNPVLSDVFTLYTNLFLTYQDYLDYQDYLYYIVFETLSP